MASLVRRRKMALCLCLVGLTMLALATSMKAQEEATASASAPDAASEFVNAVVTSQDLALLTKALTVTGLADVLPEFIDVGVTIFAPTNASFQSLGPRLLECMASEPGLSMILKPILMHHVVMGNFTAESLTGMGVAYLDALYGSRLLITHKGEDGTIRVDNANIISADAISSPKSVAHVIDSVLVPAEVIPDIRRICLV
eukprot:TRINITY_DN2_c0_g1_i1.p1 TRINITY_DN2_c0_g1~~TRINITY_DN2_c0_g1_i1.p1  ORF type:complete len:200 (-),score=26.15 TRINITY_DN2_c0_g1_i1:1497-2096(-)